MHRLSSSPSTRARATGRPQLNEARDERDECDLANTDGPATRPEAEHLLHICALERLLGCRRGQADDLADALARALKPTKDLPLADLPRTGGKGTTVREVWVRDAFVLRGFYGHGRLRPAKSSLWSLPEHLLLESFVYPLVLKNVLAAIGAYRLTDDDQDKIDAFERLLCQESLLVERTAELKTDPWHDTLQRASWDRGKRRLGEELSRLLRGDPDGSS